MRLLLQRVKRAEVHVDGKCTGNIGYGLLVLCGFKKEDPSSAIPKMADKCLNLRIFEDEQGKMNLSLLDIKGELLAVSQFTLYADCRKGRRPGFDISMPPEQANLFYQILLQELRKSGLKIEEGIFGAKMEVELINHGPVTIMLDDDELSQP
jgi:D-tyrosyl-tRNA(Tyr) deacylase